MVRSASSKPNLFSKKKDSSKQQVFGNNNDGVTFLPRSASSQSLDSNSAASSCNSSSLGVGTFAALDDMNSMLSKTNFGDNDCHHNQISDELLDAVDRTAVDDPLSHVGQHPALQSVCVMDCVSERRIVPNANEPFVLDNDCFTGTVMLLMRTPDVDLPLAGATAAAPAPTIDGVVTATGGEPFSLGTQQQAVSAYFRGKKRRFEFQFQIRLKRVPTGALFLGCELEHAIKVGTLTKGLVGILLAMVRRINPGFHYSWGVGDGSHGGAKLNAHQLAMGEYEKTHLSFPVEASMDRIVITKPGETLPTLGEELEESAESVKRRRKLGAGSVDWNTTDTFTMCLWSAYADWIQWKSINVPGVSPFSLSRVTGAQPIYLSVYEITSCTSAEYKKKRPAHAQRDLRIYTRLEFTNDTATVGGLAERLLGRRCASLKQMPVSRGGFSEHSIPDTESVGSDLETMSRISHITT
jgi:Protein of unknown function (DUF1769)